MAPDIPDRWKDYSPVGKKIAGTRFIAFKVPLKKHISKTVERHIRLDGDILLESIPNLGLIIDLTNTCRYYDGGFFIKKGVMYEKLMVPGKEIPAEYLVNRFKLLVKKYLKENSHNDKLIGVHCTHGVNRTGYFICNYMVRELAIEPDEAINRFAKARGHKIERTNYIKALKELPRISTELLPTSHSSSQLLVTHRSNKYDSSSRSRKDRSDRSHETHRRTNYSERRGSPNRHERRYRNRSPLAYGRNRESRDFQNPSNYDRSYYRNQSRENRSSYTSEHRRDLGRDYYKSSSGP